MSDQRPEELLPPKDEDRKNTLALVAHLPYDAELYQEYFDAIGECIDDPVEVKDKVDHLLSMAALRIANESYTRHLTKDSTPNYSKDIEGGRIRLGLAGRKLKNASPEMAGVSIRQKYLGDGHVTEQLPCSMITLTMRAPTLGDVASLHRQLLMNRAQYGRESFGLVLSASDSLMKEDCLDFCLRHVTHATVEYKSPMELKSIIRASDIDIVLHMMNCLMHYKPFPYTRTCTAPIVPPENEDESPTMCTHVDKGDIDLRKLFRINWMDLSEQQQIFMNDRTTQHKKRDILKRQMGNSDEDIDRVEANRSMRHLMMADDDSELYVVMGNPTAKRYFSDTSIWVNKIIRLNESLSSKVDKKEREAYMTSQINMTMLEQYIHLIRRIEDVDRDTGEVTVHEDPIAIRNTITELQGDDEFRNKLISAYEDTIGEIHMGWIGTVADRCPSCGKMPIGSESNDRIVPFPVSMIFFTLAAYALNRSHRKKGLSMGQMSPKKDTSATGDLEKTSD